MRLYNKKANFNYKLLDKMEVGIVLSGSEVKAVKRGLVDFSTSHVKIIGNEAFMIGANISGPDVKDSTRSRKLLLHRTQLREIEAKQKRDKLTIVPVKLYTKGSLIKLEIALAKSKKEYQKKASLKKKDIERDLERELRSRD